MAKTTKTPSTKPSTPQQPKPTSSPANKPSERQSGGGPLEKGIGSGNRPKK